MRSIIFLNKMFNFRKAFLFFIFFCIRNTFVCHNFFNFITIPEPLMKFELVITTPLSVNWRGLRFKRDTQSQNPYNDNLSKLDFVLMGLGVEEQECFEAVICALHQNPLAFEPLPNILGNILNMDMIVTSTSATTNGTRAGTSSRYHRYLEAARLGQSLSFPSQDSSCHLITNGFPVHCKQLVHRILDTPAFKLLQFVYNFASIHFI